MKIYKINNDKFYYVKESKMFCHTCPYFVVGECTFESDLDGSDCIGDEIVYIPNIIIDFVKSLGDVATRKIVMADDSFEWYPDYEEEFEKIGIYDYANAVDVILGIRNLLDENVLNKDFVLV